MNTLAMLVLAAVIEFAFAFSTGYSVRGRIAAHEALVQENNARIQLENERSTLQGALNEISSAWQTHYQKTYKDADSTITQLRSDGIRLRVQLADAKVSSLRGSCGPDADGKAELHPNASRFLIGQAKRADEQVEALQAVIVTLQGGQNAKKESRP